MTILQPNKINYGHFCQNLVKFTNNCFKTVIDSWGKPPEGILSGHVNAMGDFDECVGLNGNSGEAEASEFQGQYCTTYIVNSAPSFNEGSSKNISQHVLKHAVSLVELEVK